MRTSQSARRTGWNFDQPDQSRWYEHLDRSVNYHRRQTEKAREDIEKQLELILLADGDDLEAKAYQELKGLVRIFQRRCRILAEIEAAAYWSNVRGPAPLATTEPGKIHLLEL
jgi:hypothetical protein